MTIGATLVAQHAIAAAATVFRPWGTGNRDSQPPADQKIVTWLNGSFDTPDNTLVGLDYKAEFFPFVGVTTLDGGIQDDVAMVDEAIATTPGKKTVVGESMGAAVIAEEKRRLMASDNPPPAGDITFVTCR